MAVNLRKNLDTDELSKLNSEYLNWSPTQRETKWNEWSEIFGLTTPQDEYDLRHSYFRWYTQMTWDNYLAHNSEFFVDFMIDRQVPMALKLEIDVFDKIMRYLYSISADLKGLRDLFAKSRDAFTISDSIIGEVAGQPYKLVDAVKEMILIRSRGRDAIEMSAFFEKLSQAMFPKEDDIGSQYFTEDHGTAAQNLVDLIDMFLDIAPERVYVLVMSYIHPGYKEDSLVDIADLEDVPHFAPVPTESATILIEEIAPPGGVVAPSKETVASQAPKEKITAEKPVVPVKQPEPPKLAKPATPKVEVPKPSATTTEKVKPSYTEIKNKIDSAFAKDAQGDYQDIDGVMEALQKAADKYNDPKISELLFWDEGKGKFGWNV